MSDKAKLLERIRKATGPDRDLDEQLALAIGGWKQSEDSHYTESPEGLDYYYPSEHWPHYTASIDAALALTEKLLPGWYWEVALGVTSRLRVLDRETSKIDHVGPYWASAYPKDVSEEILEGGKSPALALLAALLSALIAHSGET